MTETCSNPVAVRKQQLTWIAIVFSVVVCLDQATKTVICYTIPEGSVLSAEHQNEFFYFTHQRNKGLVGGMFSESRAIALAAPVMATLVLIYLFRHLDPNSRVQRFAYGLVGAGAIGNLIDRFFRPDGVVDFLQFHFWFIPWNFPWKYYPAFNIADSAICTGVFLLILSWRSLEPQEESDAPDNR